MATWEGTHRHSRSGGSDWVAIRPARKGRHRSEFIHFSVAAGAVGAGYIFPTAAMYMVNSSSPSKPSNSSIRCW